MKRYEKVEVYYFVHVGEFVEVEGGKVVEVVRIEHVEAYKGLLLVTFDGVEV